MEELNQVQDSQAEGLFDDLVEDNEVFGDTETEEIEATEQTSEEADKQPVSQQPFLRIRYNKEDVDLTQDEAIALAQKGKNWEKLNQRYTELTSEIDELARLNGMDRDSYLQSLGRVQTSILAKKELEALKQKYPNSDEALLEDMANRIAQDQINSLKNQQTQAVNKEANTQKEILNQQLTRFERRYPNVDASKLDAKVYELMQEGYTLLEAYEEVETVKNEAKKKVEERNNANKSKSLGSTSNVEGIDKDDFLSGFLEGD